MDGMGRRIPPGATGAEQILNSSLASPSSSTSFFCSAAEGEGKQLEYVWDAPGARAAKMLLQSQVPALYSTGCKSSFHMTNLSFALCFKGDGQAKGSITNWA